MCAWVYMYVRAPPHICLNHGGLIFVIQSYAVCCVTSFDCHFASDHVKYSWSVFFPAIDAAHSCHLIAHCVAWWSCFTLLVIKTMCYDISSASCMLVCLTSSVFTFFCGSRETLFRWLGFRLGLCVTGWVGMKIAMYCSSTNLCNFVISAFILSPRLHLTCL